MMQKKLIQLVYITLIVPVAIVTFIPKSGAAYNPLDSACKTSGSTTASTGDSAVCQTEKDKNPVTTTMASVVNIMSFVIGAASVVIIIIGGFQYITSTGESGKISKAKDMILYAVIGLVVTAFARGILSLVMGKF